MANTLQIKRSAYNGTTAPSDSAVIAGELAIAQSSKRLYIGRENNSGGTVEAYHLPLLTDLTVNSTSFALADDSVNANDNGQTLTLAANVAGDGLALNSNALKVNVDNSTIELANDALRLKTTQSIFVVSDGSNTSGITPGGTATFQGTANEVTVAESAGTVTIGMPDDIVVTGNLTVNGTTTTVNSTAVTIDDPVFTLGGDSAPGSDDNKDRGIEFRYHTGSAAKIGFFGYDDSDGKFKFIPDASNSSEVFSGSVGSAVFADVSASTISDATINGGSF
jgi:hypothetical protein